jgi:hypothetical protein
VWGCCNFRLRLKLRKRSEFSIPFLGGRISINCESRWTQEGDRIDSYITGPGWQRIHVDFYEAEGGAPPEIKSVFVSGSKQKKLFVIVAWNGGVSALDTGGSIYQVFAYDELIEQGGAAPSLRRDAELTRRFGIGFDGVREGKHLACKYKTAASVKRQLLEWGYR